MLGLRGVYGKTLCVVGFGAKITSLCVEYFLTNWLLIAAFFLSFFDFSQIGEAYLPVRLNASNNNKFYRVDKSGCRQLLLLVQKVDDKDPL